MKKRMISGIKPTGELTLGNYIGAIKQFIQYQEEYELFVFLADLHALTLPIDANELRKNSEDILAIYLACGLDPNKVVIFKQSDIHEHAELGYIMACNSYMGELQRMTQYKDKTQKMKNDSIPTGIFIYPTLMAADILLYQADFVPVGIDQKQHVELTRNIAIKFNKKYGETFKIPDAYITKEGTKIMDLVNPDKKMSKSSENQKGVIRMLDDINTIRKKIMGATTDSDCLIHFDPENKPGISNLINICVALTGKSIQEIEAMFAGKNYGDFKHFVADIVTTEIEAIQGRYQKIINSPELDKLLDENVAITRALAKEKFLLMKEKMGLYK